MSNSVLITLLTRLTLGLLFCQYGISKIADYGAITAGSAKGFEATWLPMGVVWMFAYLIPVWEAVVGVAFQRSQPVPSWPSVNRSGPARGSGYSASDAVVQPRQTE